jgi:UDP-glucuronate 4-epimerase
MSRVVVTGGLGFIGRHLCGALQGAGHEVTVVDDRSAPHAASAAPADGVRVVVAQAAGSRACALLDQADAVVHLAAVPGVRTRAPVARLAAQNVGAVEALGRAAAQRGVRFLLASTSSVYGDAEAIPTPETAPPRPLNPYARTKVAAEDACGALARDGGDAVIARLFTVFGPGQRPDMAFSRWIDCLDEGRPLPWYAPPGAARELTYVDDAVRGLMAVLDHGRPGEAYNIAGCGPVPLRAVLRELAEIAGADPRIEPLESGVREARVTAACGRKAREELGYEPRTGLADGLRLQYAARMQLSRPAAAA